MTTVLANGSENCLAVGTRLSDFEVTGILGEGGFGIVYIAFDHALQRTVAIKEYMPGALAMRGADQSVTMRAERHRDTFNVGLKSFINEARFLAQFDHPSLVKVYRFWEQNRTAYTAMQYYDGRTIKDIVETSPEQISEAWCARIVRQILEALEMLYTMKILHRDVSPDNIIVQENGDAVLLDFGSARQIIGDMTKGLTVILKPGYAPVEQYAGDASLEQGAYTDIYALAAVMYFAILREAPPTSIARMIKDPVAPLRQRGLPGYSDTFLAALDKGLAVLAQDRPQTIAEFRALLGIAAGEAPRTRPAGSTQRFATLERLPATLPAPAPAPNPVAVLAPGAAPRPRARPVARLTVLAAVLLLMAVAGYGWLARAPQSGAAPALAPVPAPAPVIAAEAAKPTVPVPVFITDDVAVPAAAALPETASYKLVLKPWGTVYVDDKERGVSPPLKRLVLPAGKHKIRVVNPEFPDYVTEVVLGKDKTGTIEHDFSATKK